MKRYSNSVLERVKTNIQTHKHTNKHTNKIQRNYLVIIRKHSPWGTGNCFFVVRWGLIPTPGSSALPFSWPSRLPSPFTSPFASCGLPSSAAALPSSSAVFLTFRSSLATAVCSWQEEPWTFCRQSNGQGLASAHGWWLTPGPGDTRQPQGNNFYTGLWLWPETEGHHLILKLQLFFLLVNKRLLILLRWKRLFPLAKHRALPSGKACQMSSVWQSYGRDIRIQTWHRHPHSSH